jgi:hypothetical protein
MPIPDGLYAHLTGAAFLTWIAIVAPPPPLALAVCVFVTDFAVKAPGKRSRRLFSSEFHADKDFIILLVAVKSGGLVLVVVEPATHLCHLSRETRLIQL